MIKLPKNIVAFCVSFLLYSITLQSQTVDIKGVVIDSLTRDKIEFANILLLNTDSSFYSGATTDSTGSFVFSVEERKSYLLKVSCLGYNSKFFPVAFNQLFEAELTQDEIVLNEVLIKGKFNVIKNNASNLIFRVTDLIREEAFLATHILEKIPTVYVDFNNKIFVKGSGNVLILQNGIELPSNTLVNQISPQSIERVEISRIIPAKYLNKGVSSIVNIITKRVEKRNLKLHSNLSPNRLYDADVSLKINKEKHSFYTYYNLYYRNFLENKTIDNQINHIYSTYYLQTKPRKEFDNEFFYGYSYNLSNKMVIGLDGYLSLYDENFITKNNINQNLIDLSASKINFTTQNYSSYIQYKDSVNTANARINLNNKKVDDKISYIQDLEDNSMDDNCSFSSEVDYSRIFSETLKLNIGLNYSHLNNQTEFNYSKESNHYGFMENNVTAYCDLNKDFKNISLLVGVNLFTQDRYFRNDDLNLKSTYFSPKFSGIYTFNDYNSLMLGFYSSQNFPSLWQLMAIPIHITPNYTVKGNPHLKPENITNLSFEYDYSKGTAYFSSTLFYKQAKNKIVDEYANTEENTLASSKINLNKCSDWGMSLLFNNSLFDWWTIRMSLDIFNKNIPDNSYYKKNLVSTDASITNVFNYAKKWMLAVRYGYNGRRLAYNGYFKPYNNSLAQLRYNMNKKLSFSLIWIQPIDVYKSESMVYYNSSGSYANNINKIKTSTVLFSFTYNILNDPIKRNNQIYSNEDKKY
ncbi:MAG: TonB-dependent receptor [Prevotellaceae bacterium]|jgi:outer membrane receptor for ferrienterochelin and colicin|nr:TonB-dependent receptor [Prevotellaceae bacterium]